jgi:DNA-binding protein HU-beta
MKKKELISAIAEDAGVKKVEAEKMLDALVNVVASELGKGEKLTIPSLGTFQIKERKEKEGRNPQTGEKMIIPAGKSPSFKVAKYLKDAVK